MKRIVEGVTYNTNTSTLVAQDDRPADNWNPTSATWKLYQTRGGAFFLHEHEQWNVNEDGEWVTKERHSFTPMTDEEAHKWVMTGDVEVFAEVFPDPPEAVAEDRPSATIYVRVPQSLKGRIDDAAADAKLSVNAWAMRCCERCLRDQSVSDDLARAHYIARSVTSIPDGYTAAQMVNGFDQIAGSIADVWGALGLPRDKGQDLDEDVTLYSVATVTSVDDHFRHEWEPHQSE